MVTVAVVVLWISSYFIVLKLIYAPLVITAGKFTGKRFALISNEGGIYVLWEKGVRTADQDDVQEVMRRQSRAWFFASQPPDEVTRAGYYPHPEAPHYLGFQVGWSSRHTAALQYTSSWAGIPFWFPTVVAISLTALTSRALRRGLLKPSNRAFEPVIARDNEPTIDHKAPQ